MGIWRFRIWKLEVGSWKLGVAGELARVGLIELPDDVVQRGGFGGHGKEFDARLVARIPIWNLAGTGDAEELDVCLAVDIDRENADGSGAERLFRFEMTARAAHVIDTDALTTDENRAARLGVVLRHQCVRSLDSSLSRAPTSSSRREHSLPPTDTGVLDVTFAR